MPTLRLTSKYEYFNKLAITPSELVERFLFGIPLRSNNGGQLSQTTILSFIRFAQDQVEKTFVIKLFKQEFEESKDFYLSDWNQWGYVRTSYPVNKPLRLDGFINSVRAVEYPPEWLVAKKSTDNDLVFRHVRIVPGSSAPVSGGTIVYSGIVPNLGYGNYDHIPNYWNVKYETGFCKIPEDILNFIGMLAAINILNIMGNIIVGPGLSGQSISIDGLSQSVSSKNQAFDGTVERYVKMLVDLKYTIGNHYKGFTMMSM